MVAEMATVQMGTVVLQDRIEPKPNNNQKASWKSSESMSQKLLVVAISIRSLVVMKRFSVSSKFSTVVPKTTLS